MKNSELTKEELFKLSDYVLLNSCSVRSSGVYNGKSGMALSLFQTARYLNNEELEDKAFDLIQEALLTKNEDIGFENGLSGVGYVFLKLIEDEYIDADFDDFFGKQTDTVLQVLETRKYDSAFMLQSFPVVLFLHRLKAVRSDKRIPTFIDLLFEEMERYLSIRLFHFEAVTNTINRMEVPITFSLYLQYALETNYATSPTLIDTYVTLYKKGRISSSYSVGYYLDKNGENSKQKEIADMNKTNALTNVTASFLTLREQLDLLTMLKSEDMRWKSHGQALEQQLFNKDNSGLENSLLTLFSPGVFHPGYGYGVARFLSYCTENPCLI